MMTTAIGRLRAIGWVEAVSFLLLLGIAMPLKYLAGYPLAVRVVGLAHGVLFIALILTALIVQRQHDWPTKKVAWVVGAALLPCGPFLIDRRLREEQERQAADGR